MRLIKNIFRYLILFNIIHTGILNAESKVTESLDKLVDFPNCWKMTPEVFEKNFTNNGRKAFRWLTTTKSRAQFTQRTAQYANAELSLFEKQIKPVEVVVDFRDEKLNLVSFSIFNRGDAGEISSEKFKELFMTCGKAMSIKTKSKPITRKANKQQGLKTAGYSWNSPLAIGLLEHNDGALEAQKPEFLRLRVAKKGAKGGLAAAMTNTRGGAAVRLSSLKAFVDKDKDGNVYIRDLPMVDQGDKGYCVVASVQRLFEHYGIGASMHQLAEVTNASAKRGTNILSMVKEVDKIDYRFKTHLKIIAMQSSNQGLSSIDVKKSEYYVGKPLDIRKIKKAIYKSIDDGVPMLWSMELGKYPEKPQLNPQTSGYHMRIIIGYNDDKETIIFSDSWGMGHEFKTMRLDHAYKVTTGLFVLKPSVN